MPYEVLLLNYTPEDSIYQVDQLVDFRDSTVSTVAWSWDLGDNSFLVTDRAFEYSYSEAGDYEVILSAVDSNNCADTAYFTLTIEESGSFGEEGVIDVPTGFTPNNDSYNDILFVRGGPFLEFTFRIYNEWGNEVFVSKTPQEGWDGEYKSQEQPPGVYVWVLQGETTDGEVVSMSGEVTLIR
jgi:gliding motility-associated-like protein